ncbi:hypothetical protein [Limimaricola pyoseonensis]|uniref:hypothetical protein n=1 Tax=Limimaricola pyoseonensis TaxID=521013 RepID=UPI00104281A1|nr:hypothetical protein [Limimaricola pyoseonensis]
MIISTSDDRLTDRNPARFPQIDRPYRGKAAGSDQFRSRRATMAARAGPHARADTPARRKHDCIIDKIARHRLSETAFTLGGAEEAT